LRRSGAKGGSVCGHTQKDKGGAQRKGRGGIATGIVGKTATQGAGEEKLTAILKRPYFPRKERKTALGTRNGSTGNTTIS